MAYKTILVCLTNEQNAQKLTQVGATLAARCEGHLIGLHTLQAMMIYPGIAMHLTGQIIDDFDMDQQKQADKIRAIFEAESSGREFVSEWRCVPAASQNAANQIIKHARCADLVIIGQADPEHDRADQASVQHDVIVDCGRPVLVVPKEGVFETVATNAVIGWSATREATRAMHDAIPLLEGGGTATVLWAAQSETAKAELASTAIEMAACLDRQSIDVTVSPHEGGQATGEALLQKALETGADMIVTGAFGHSRFYDFAIGATSSFLLENMTVPVLFSR